MLAVHWERPPDPLDPVWTNWSAGEVCGEGERDQDRVWCEGAAESRPLAVFEPPGLDHGALRHQRPGLQDHPRHARCGPGSVSSYET
eukprot:625539-Pyramimonas_sp.AAC.1